MTHTKPRDFVLSRGLKCNPLLSVVHWTTKCERGYLAWDPEADLDRGTLRNPILDTSQEKFGG